MIISRESPPPMKLSSLGGCWKFSSEVVNGKFPNYPHPHPCMHTLCGATGVVISQIISLVSQKSLSSEAGISLFIETFHII